MTRSPALYLVVPDWIDDPARPSGGNTYDRRLRDELQATGWEVHTCPVGGPWPRPDGEALRELHRALAVVPEGSPVVLDGLVASAAPEVMVPASERLRLVVLVHLPLGVPDDDDEVRGSERAVLEASTAVLATSDWSRGWLLATYGLDPERVHTVPPGVDPAELARGTPDGRDLLCVGAVTPAKGHDVLLAALAGVADLPWRCRCVGSLSLDRGFVEEVRRAARRSGLERRFTLTGVLTGHALARRYDRADLLVLATRRETYGMTVTEALARGLPVLASDVGGVPEALGAGRDGHRPGRLLPAGDVAAWSDALRSWLADAGLRDCLRRSALERRATLTGWWDTAQRVGRLLSEVAA